MAANYSTIHALGEKIQSGTATAAEVLRWMGLTSKGNPIFEKGIQILSDTLQIFDFRNNLSGQAVDKLERQRDAAVRAYMAERTGRLGGKQLSNEELDAIRSKADSIWEEVNPQE